MMFRAFLSCKFPVHEDVHAIARMLETEFTAYISDEPKIGSLPYLIKEKISEADCLIAIAIDGDSPFIQNEIAIAYALGKPIAAICKAGVEFRGILPDLCTWISYNDLRDCIPEIPRLKQELLNKLSSAYLIPGGPENLLVSATAFGMLGVYPSRATGFHQFMRFWDREKDIAIVASTLEGFRKGIGLDPSELLGDKLRDQRDSRIRILLTHPDLVSNREQQEKIRKDSISLELHNCREQLFEIQRVCSAGDRLTWKFFKGAPTCFMIAAGDFMLLNPYLYMQSAIFNFSLIVRNTKSKLDIYNRYKKYHFELAWNDSGLASSEAETPRDK